MLKTNTWHKSTRSGAAGHCVEVFWKKSSRSNPSGNCLETRSEGNDILVRDTKLGENSPVFTVAAEDWNVFIGEIKGLVTFPAGQTVYTSDPGVGMRLHSTNTEETLLFTVAEWDAFLDGVRDGEFDLQAA